jgi:hypothetical protein
MKNIYKKMRMFFKSINCIHEDTRYRSDRPKYEYMEVCKKCGQKVYVNKLPKSR